MSSTITFLTIFRILTIRYNIFKSIETICNNENEFVYSKRESKKIKRKLVYRKGRDIIESMSIYEIIGIYALPWSFLKHYLPSRVTIRFNDKFMTIAYQSYVAHPNSTLETLKQIIKYSPPFERSLIFEYQNHAIQRGDIEFVEYIIQGCPKKNLKKKSPELIKYALDRGQHKIAEYIFNEYMKVLGGKISSVPVFEEIFVSSARNGNMTIVKIILLNTYIGIIRSQYKIRDSIRFAMSNGKYSVGEYIISQSLPDLDDRTIGEIIEHSQYGDGCIEVFKILINHNKSNLITKSHFDSVAQRGHLDIIQYLHENNIGCTTKAMNNAAENGHLDVVKFLHFNRNEGCTTEAMDRAASRGHLKIVEFLHYNRSEGCTPNAIDFASSKGHLNIVEFLHYNRNEGCTTKAMDRASENGHLDIVKFLHLNRSEGCTTEAMDNASERGHLNIVEFLHQNRNEGCTTKAMDRASWSGCTTNGMVIRRGHLEIVQFLHYNRTEGCTTEAIDEVSMNNHIPILEFLLHNRSEGCTTKAMDNAAWNGNLDIVKYLHYNRTEGCTTKAMDNAARNGHFDIVQFLHHHRSEGCTEMAMTYAIIYGEDDTMIKWFHQNRSEGYERGLWKHYSKESLNMEWVLSNEQFDVSDVLCDTIFFSTNYNIDTIKFLLKNGYCDKKDITKRISNPPYHGAGVTIDTLYIHVYLWENGYYPQ